MHRIYNRRITGEFLHRMEGEIFFNNRDSMSSSRSAMWGDEISENSYTSGATREGVTPRRLSSIWIDCEEDSASYSYWKNSSERVETENFE